MWLAIEGIVGAGKTTTATLIAERSSLVSVIEPSDQHPLLDAYYGNPHQFALETELIFMALQSHCVSAASGASDLISDFAPRKNFIFARLSCSDEELELLEAVDRHLWGRLPTPDITVVLNVPPAVCRDRILERGRSYEQGIDIADLARLQDGYVEATRDLGKQVMQLDLTGEETRDQVVLAVMGACGIERP